MVEVEPTVGRVKDKQVVVAVLAEAWVIFLAPRILPIGPEEQLVVVGHAGDSMVGAGHHLGAEVLDIRTIQEAGHDGVHGVVGEIELNIVKIHHECGQVVNGNDVLGLGLGQLVDGVQVYPVQSLVVSVQGIEQVAATQHTK